MACLGVKRGELALFNAEGDLASPDIVRSRDERVQVIQGGMRSLQPFGLKLLQHAGVKQGDAFVLVLDNNRTSVACLLAAMHLKCVCVLVDCNLVAVLDQLKTETGVTKVLTVNDATTSLSVDDSIQPNTEKAETLWLHESDIKKNGCVCFLTSGSVGKPKIVPCTWTHMLLQGESTQQQFHSMGPLRLLCGTPISHAFAVNTILTLYTSPYDTDSELCFAASAVGLYTLLTQRTNRYTVLYASPGTYTALTAMPRTSLYADLSYCGGTRLSIALCRKMRDDYGLLLAQAYGTTELGNIAAWCLYNKNYDDEFKLMEKNDTQLYVGSLRPGVEGFCNEKSELTITTPWQCLGYVKDQVLHRFERLTFDLGSLMKDDNGMAALWIQNRLRSPVEINWQNERQTFDPNEIESIFSSHSEVSDVLVLSQTQEDRNQNRIRVRLVLQDNATIDFTTLKQWCADHNTALRDALAIELCNFLPCSPAGKITYT